MLLGSSTSFITATETLLMENEMGSQWYLVVMGSSSLVPLAISIVGAQSQEGMKVWSPFLTRSGSQNGRQIWVAFGNRLSPFLERKVEVDGLYFFFFPFVALIKREVKATLNRMLKVPGLPLPHEDARELRKDCSPGCLHRAPFPSQIINEIKVHASWLAFFPLFPFYFSPLCLKSTPLS